MCQALDVPFAAEALTAFAEVSTVTGHLARAGEPRIAAATVSLGAARARAELSDVPGYQALLVELGYPE
jgi:hypothetical protein